MKLERLAHGSRFEALERIHAVRIYEGHPGAFGCWFDVGTGGENGNCSFIACDAKSMRSSQLRDRVIARLQHDVAETRFKEQLE